MKTFGTARWGATLTALSLVILGLLMGPVVWADYNNITVDGDCNTGGSGEWPSNTWIQDDGDEGDIPDQYDWRDVYATLSTNGSQYYIRFNTASNLYLNAGASTTFWYDTDYNSSTGYYATCPTGSAIGAERRVVWNMETGSCSIYQRSGSSWVLVSNDCNGVPIGEGQKSSTCIETGADSYDLGIDSTDKMRIRALFENADGEGPPDDIVCFDYDIPTAVSLASFTATWDGDQVLVAWETTMEVDTAGFNLWRSTAPDGGYAQINSTLIPSASPGGMQGAAYSYTDANVTPGTTYYYKLEELVAGGGSNWYGPGSTGGAEGGPTSVTLSGTTVEWGGGILAWWPFIAVAVAGMGVATLARLRRRR